MSLQIWTEKYRPKMLSEIKGQDAIIPRIKAFVEQKNMPHLLFAGPAGVGKTTCALAIARELYGETWKDHVLELNASNERGIDVVRNKIKDFARTRAVADIPFKIIYLDEADALTQEAQHALRRTMEDYVTTTRFILSCVTPNTKILLPEEREITISDFIKHYKHKKLLHINNLSAERSFTKDDLVLATVSLSPQSINKKVLEIRTINGRKIKVTEDHKLLTIWGWKAAGQITKADKLLIYPNLEDTPYEEDNTKIIKLSEFVEFLSAAEEKDGLKTIENAKCYRNLKTNEKEKILQRVSELKERVKENKSLTKRELEIYILVKQNDKISRKKLQEKMSLTRMGINYLLLSLEKKGYIKRIINKKVHSFIITDQEPHTIRTDKDIERQIEKEFDLKISYTAVRKSTEILARGKVDRVLGELKRKELLDITYNDIKKIGALARICGFMLGDGHLVHNSIRLHFSGNNNALEEVKKDLAILGYSNYSKIISKVLKNTICGRSFTGTTTSFYLDSRSLSLFLQFLGITKGDKTIIPFTVPEFIKKGTKFVKREFIRALFGCDADKPNYKKMNFEALSLRQNKADFLKKEMMQYYNDISNLLIDFNINSYSIIRDKGEIRGKDNVHVLCFSLIIRPNNENLFKFFSRIGYAYEKYKIDLARLSAEYLRHKCNLINIWKEKSKLIVAAVDNGDGIWETARRFEVKPDLVMNQLKGKEIHLPRNNFMSFNEWIKKYRFNDLLVINEIYEIKEIGEKRVMDITCCNDHNFITNGFISHNCNYSSKIIPAIQSRCAVFRFKPLPKQQAMTLLSQIANGEGLTINLPALEFIYMASEGDMRKAENILQACASVNKDITEKVVNEVVSFAEPQAILDVLKLSLSGQFISAKSKLTDTIIEHGLSGLDAVKQIQVQIWNLNIPERQKVELIKACGEYEFRIVEGSNEFIQLSAMLAHFALIGGEIHR